MRSRCRRSIMTMSASAAGLRACRAQTSTPKRSMPGGRSVEGATTRTRAPSALSRMMFERATRECRMSPQIATSQAFDAALVAADRERIEQGLRRMLVRAVAGIDHRAVDLACQQFDRAGRMMAHDNDVGMHGVERHRRVDQRLALAHRGRADRHVHDVGAKALAGEFERGLGAGRRLRRTD